MSTYLTAQSLTVSLASVSLFQDITFTLNQGDRIGLIGHNGCGKSTLMKVLSGRLDDFTGTVTKAHHCHLAYVEQHLPAAVAHLTLLDALAERVETDEFWRAELMLSELGFSDEDWQLPVSALSGGQHMRLLLARAVISEPDLLLLDEPSNHLDLPALLWLEQFLRQWRGSFVLVSHDQTLLDHVTSKTWIMRDQTLHSFDLPCSAARTALTERDETDRLRHQAEQKEIDRIDRSAKRLAEWGKVYDNEDLARKAKTMQARKARLEEAQTSLSQGAPWRLMLSGDVLPANRLLEVGQLRVSPPDSQRVLFETLHQQVKSGERVAILGANGSGKSTLLTRLFACYQAALTDDINSTIRFHPQCRLGYYDQAQAQLNDADSLSDALIPFAPVDDDIRKRALISAGFSYDRHQQTVAGLSGGERARLLFIGLTLARYHLLFLDEPTNHLDLEGKEELIETLNQYEGGALIVSHDRSLIEQACNRFWLIQDGQLEEHHDPAVIYERIGHAGVTGAVSETLASAPAPEVSSDMVITDEECLLTRLIELEGLLEADLNRKPKRQKPALQQQWRDEIEAISARL
ncbi:putative ABC transporter ATP-binding protein YheS [Vibrio aerogenes CECT 7868]|uniref:Putative ABC transporter ATP-binding protein YheS n=1 Tax=Vibrio aerogenes CECT 7868 TaxID=1216006 RepID=A0A1M6ATJ9_9VIBR|nr:ABC-F family ATP-binding cassette domain-containing protein [Vibrio aerogenes]SHI39757.1 putative ABC transporter ATP-binding protein YheS [Vibrio aerogenes CECT 7868]